MSTVSVIIPTWNRAKTIEAAVKSALSQTCQVTEVLVCDDGSDDNTEEIIERITKSDGRVKWIKGSRAGLPAVPRNRGIKESKGEWLAFLDSDDEWLPEKIQRQLDHLNRTGCKASSTNAYRYLSSTENKGIYLDINIDRINLKQLIVSNYIICSSAIIHHSLIPIVKKFPEGNDFKAIEDYLFWLKVATQTDFAYVNEPLVKYFDIPAQSIRKGGDADVQKRTILNEWMAWVTSNNNFIKKEDIQLVSDEIIRMENLHKNKLFKIVKRISNKLKR